MKYKETKEITEIVGIIQDLAKDIIQDTNGLLFYKDKKMFFLNEVETSSYAILDYVKQLNEILEPKE